MTNPHPSSTTARIARARQLIDKVKRVQTEQQYILGKLRKERRRNQLIKYQGETE